ncbi:MAG TPA: phospholipid carrier-dependent glycosyltransferase [Candidatus Paceibacterota bacterium]
MNYNKLYVIILIIASIATHFIFFGYPQETVFDEVHFGKFLSGYFTHEYFFDIHPPLGKLLLSGVGYITGFEPGFSFAEIGQQFPNKDYLWLRLLPTLAGTLLPIVIFFLVLEMGMSKLAAFFAGIAAALDGALLVQSRFILLDSFLLIFGFSGILFYFLFRRSDKNYFLLLAGAMPALAASVKWTGLSFLTLIVIFYLFSLLKSPQKIKLLIRGFCFLGLVPLAIYFLIFKSHFLLLNKSGPGDAFMTKEFRKTLVNSTDSQDPEIKPLNIIGKFEELNIQMYKSNATLTATHPYSSQWYTWPFMIRPIYYWNYSPTQEQTDNQETTIKEVRHSRIYLLGNPIIWWGSTVAIVYLLITTLPGLFRKSKAKMVTIFLCAGYLLNILPFIGISRAMFLYHYFPALIFAIISLAYLVDKLNNKKRVFTTLILISVALFIFFAPLTYGLPLSDSAYNLRNWLPSWL